MGYKILLVFAFLFSTSVGHGNFLLYRGVPVVDEEDSVFHGAGDDASAPIGGNYVPGVGGAVGSGTASNPRPNQDSGQYLGSTLPPSGGGRFDPNSVGQFDSATEAIGDTIVKYEARRDANGNLMVYNLPSNDGGGSYEIAGINQRYHPEEAAHLRSLIQSGRHAEADAFARNYILSYTNNSARMAGNAGSEMFIRDIAFNRGPGGANWIVRHAAGLPPDMGMNDSMRQEILRQQQADPQGFLQRMHQSARHYEVTKVGIRPNLDRGLVNRNNNRYNDSVAILNAGL